MRKCIDAPLRVGDADLVEQFKYSCTALLAIQAKMRAQRLGDLEPDRKARIERGHRLLEDHRHVAADDFPALARAELAQIATIEEYALRGHGGGPRQQAH